MSDASPRPEAPPVDDGFIPGYILKNVGVPITLYRLVDGQKVPVSDEEGADFLTEKVHLRFDANAVSAIEDHFDGIRAVVNIEKKTPVMVDGKPVVGPAGPEYLTEVVGTEERVFYGLEAFQKAMEVRPVSAIRDAMAIALRVPPEVMGERMIPTENIVYQNAVGVAWSIAQGVDPTNAARMHKQAAAAIAKQREALASELEKTMVEDEDETTASPGNPG